MYKAYTKEQAARLAVNWSPDPNREGYIFGPDINGRFCHCASCTYYAEAVKLAEKMNRAALAKAKGE